MSLICTKCRKPTDPDDFAKNRSRPNGRRNECKKCFSDDWKDRYVRSGYGVRVWASRLKKRFGITIEIYLAMLDAQGGGCATCFAKTPGGRGKRFHVDHDHVTGRVRGLLCARCNLAIGQSNDDPGLLDRWAAYLRKNRDVKNAA